VYHCAAPASDWGSREEFDTKPYLRYFHLGQDYVVYAEILKQKSQKSQAKENFRKAIQIFKECRAEKWLEKYEIRD
jgi:hypothetical protein